MPNNAQYITFKVTVFSSCLRNYNTANDLFWTGECSIWNGCWHWWISWLPHIVTAILFWLHHGLFLHSLPPCTEVIWAVTGMNSCTNLCEWFIVFSAPSDLTFLDSLKLRRSPSIIQTFSHRQCLLRKLTEVVNLAPLSVGMYQYI